MSAEKIRIAIIDAQTMLAESLTEILNREPDFTVIGHATDGESGLQLCRASNPHLVLVDVALKKINGCALIDLLRGEFPALRVIVISGTVDPYTVWRVSRSEPQGFLEKSSPLRNLLATIRSVASGTDGFSPYYQAIKNDWLSQPVAFHKILSKREREVLLRAVAGQPDEQIGKELEIRKTTVCVHRKNIRAKLRLHNDRGLIAYARIWGLDSRANEMV